MKSQKSMARPPLRTSPEVRNAIQQSEDSVRALARRYGLNPKTIVKWRRRDSVGDLKSGPRGDSVTALNIEQQALVAAFRLHLRLPLDACLQALLPLIPQLSRSSLHRCLQRLGLSRLPVSAGLDELKSGGAAVCFEWSCLRLKKHRLFVAVEQKKPLCPR